VLGLCLFLGMAVLTDLRLLGLAFPRVTVSDLMGRLLPWTWVGAIIMVVSGSVLFLNTPVRYYTNIFNAREVRDAAAGGDQRGGLPFRDLSAADSLGSGREAAVPRANGGCGVAAALGGRGRRRTDDRLQLVRQTIGRIHGSRVLQVVRSVV